MEQNRPKVNNNTLHQDDFIGSAIAIDSAQYIIQDLMEDFSTVLIHRIKKISSK